jgi:hypothetical protein
MLVVIFGAGASYDSAPLHRAGIGRGNVSRPPLAKELIRGHRGVRPGRESGREWDAAPTGEAIVPERSGFKQDVAHHNPGNENRPALQSRTPYIATGVTFRET